MSQLSKLDPNFKPAFDGISIANELLSKVKASLEIKKFILFGSSAEQKNTPNSDLDILLVVPNNADKKKYFTFVNTPFFSPIAVDWIIMTENEYDHQKDYGGVVRIAYLTGKNIFDSSEGINDSK